MATESSVMGVIRASRPNFRNPRHDKIAYAVHSSFLAAGYSLIAAGHNAASENPPTDGDEVGVDGWNELDDGYAFVYTKTLKGSKIAVLVKCMVIGDILAIDVLNLKEENKEPFNLQINCKDYSEDETTGVNNYGQMYKNFKDLVEKLNANILAKLEPVEVSSSTHSGRSEHVTTNESVRVFPSQQNQQLGQSNIVYPPIPAFGGNGDLYPGPGAGFYPQRGPGFDGGMLVGPNDPRWFSSGQRPGLLGGIPGAPPGSRYDPIGPPDVPGFEPGRFVSTSLNAHWRWYRILSERILSQRVFKCVQHTSGAPITLLHADREGIPAEYPCVRVYNPIQADASRCQTPLNKSRNVDFN